MMIGKAHQLAEKNESGPIPADDVKGPSPSGVVILVYGDVAAFRPNHCGWYVPNGKIPHLEAGFELSEDIGYVRQGYFFSRRHDDSGSVCKLPNSSAAGPCSLNTSVMKGKK